MHRPVPVRPPAFTALLAAPLLAIAGCASPLTDRPDRDLRRAIRESAERELAEAARYPERITLSRQPRVEALQIKPQVMDELAAMAGPDSYFGRETPYGPTLLNTPIATAPITLQRAVASTVKRNLNVQFARLSPAISQQQVVVADAAFDWVLFTNSQWSATDQPRTSPAVGGSTVGVSTDQRQVVDNTVGVRRSLLSGATFTTQTQFTYTDVETDNLFTQPDPANEANIVLQLDQPLLRNFGSDIALSQVRLAQNTERDEVQSLRATLIQNVAQTEIAYWSLVRAQADLLILQRLLERGEETLRVLKARGDFDTRPGNVSDAASQVESRRADLIRAQRIYRDASDQLKQLMNDPELTIGSEALLTPSDPAIDQPIDFSVIDLFNAALANRPEVQRAIISMDNTAIRLQVADNARLPQLNLRALTRFNGLGDSYDDPYRDITESQFVDYQLSLAFETAIGNRAAEAAYSGRLYERLQGVLAYRNTVQSVFAEVKAALREVVTNYTLIEQTRAFRIAAAENLRQLLVQEQTIQGLTPEFLDLKLRRQASLAEAEQQEIAALTDYNTAIARLHAASGATLARNNILFDVQNAVPERDSSFIFPDLPLDERATSPRP